MGNFLQQLRPYRADLIFLGIVLAVPMLYFFIGIPAPILEKDAGQYYAYAMNIAQGHGFTMDGTHFSNFREPGYPYFIAALFLVFGIGNIFAVLFAQTVLLGVLGFFVYRAFASIGERRIGYVAGLCTALLPSYGLNAHFVATELPFAFLLGAIFLSGADIIIKRREWWGWYALFGLLCGSATLVRTQFALFLPFLIVVALLVPRFRSWHFLRHALVALCFFAVPIGSWIAAVHQQNGTYAITTGRPEVSLYARAVHAQMSYAGLTHYMVAWIRRSVTGGEGDAVLDDGPLGVQWGKMATTTAATEAIKKWSIATILANPGHYLYDSLTQTIRLFYIEHDYSDSLNRYVRAGIYLFIYGFFFFGLSEVWRARKNVTDGVTLALLSMLFILYNTLVLIPFFAIPRYNTPYLFLFLITGFSGIALYRHCNHHAK